MENVSDTPPPPLEEGAHTRRIARSTAVFSLATAVSRVLGLMREMVSAYYFGVAGAINAFTVAIQIPNLVRALVADAALSGAFVPVFSELLERGEKQRALARRLDALLADPPRPRRSHRALHPARTASDAAVRGSGRRLRSGRGALSRALSDRRAARALGDHRRDSQHVPPLRAAGARPGRMEPRHHPRARHRRPAHR